MKPRRQERINRAGIFPFAPQKSTKTRTRLRVAVNVPPWKKFIETELHACCISRAAKAKRNTRSLAHRCLLIFTNRLRCAKARSHARVILYCAPVNQNGPYCRTKRRIRFCLHRQLRKPRTYLSSSSSSSSLMKYMFTSLQDRYFFYFSFYIYRRRSSPQPSECVLPRKLTPSPGRSVPFVTLIKN